MKKNTSKEKTLIKSKAKKEVVKKDNIWLSDPEAHDFPAAKDYLELLFDEKEVTNFVNKLKKAKTITKKSKDIFRASGLSILPKNNTHIMGNFKKIATKKNFRLYF